MKTSITHIGSRPARLAWGLALAGMLCSAQAVAQQPVVDDLSASRGGFYNQADTESRSSGSLVLFNQVQEHQRELKELRGEVEELRHALEQLRRQSQKRYLDLDERLSRAASAPAPATVSSQSQSERQPESQASRTDSQPSGSAEVEPEAEQSPAASDESAAQKAYKAAFAHVQAREFDQAITAFKAFVSDYPDSRLTPNGYYWLGELYAADERLDDAETSFTRVIEKHADSSKVPDALYKLGLVKARQGNTERSRELLQQVRDDYPQSSAAGLAGDFLRQSRG